MAWQDIILLSILNFVGSMIANVVNGLLIVRINTDAFVLFDEKPDLLWKIPMIAVLIFAGEAALIYFWQSFPALHQGFSSSRPLSSCKCCLQSGNSDNGGYKKQASQILLFQSAFYNISLHNPGFVQAYMDYISEESL